MSKPKQRKFKFIFSGYVGKQADINESRKWHATASHTDWLFFKKNGYKPHPLQSVARVYQYWERGYIA